ncbi:MAG: lipid A biosynthesis acyltransferase [Cardiobacteriaceae bacterium]|nr:lipid A biosynthesis acyltransferase [Cardiobacteriaceae bacterium]
MNREAPKSPPFSWKYLPHYIGLGALWVVCLLPRRVAFALGAGVSHILFTLFPYRKRIVLKNLAFAFPELSERERKALCRAHIDSVGYGLIEMGMAWFWSEAKLRKILRVEIDSISQSALSDPNQPVILLGSHSTLLELGVRLLGLEVAATGMYRPQKSSFFDSWIRYQRLRASHGIPLLHFKDLRKTLSALASGQKIWYAIDQDMGHEASVFPHFFNLPTATVSIVPKLLKHQDALLIPVYFWREDDGRYVVRIKAPLSFERTAFQDQSALFDATLDLMQRVNDDVEQEIRKHPEQYFWLHRRFKSDPSGGRRAY